MEDNVSVSRKGGKKRKAERRTSPKNPRRGSVLGITDVARNTSCRIRTTGGKKGCFARKRVDDQIEGASARFRKKTDFVLGSYMLGKSEKAGRKSR